MSKKILFTASTKSHIEHFHLPYLKAFEELGWEVKAIALPVSKHFFSVQNLQAINYTRKILKSEKYDVISSQSTLAGIVTRLAVMLAGKDRKHMKIYHTAHGYLFHDNKSVKKWAYLLPEKLCGKVTDVLMVMNHEDLVIAKKYKLCEENNKIFYIDGMGIDLSKFQQGQASKEQKESFGIKENDFAYVYVAEFSKRKNHELLLRGFAKALSTLKGKEKAAALSAENLKLVLAGDGILLNEMRTLATQLEISNQVIFLGYIKNIQNLYPCCQVAVSTSRIEGLPFNIMEAMASGLPVIASDIKGHQELIEHGKNGLLFASENLEELTDRMIEIVENPSRRGIFSDAALEKVKEFSVDKVLPSIMKIYDAKIGQV